MHTCLHPTRLHFASGLQPCCLGHSKSGRTLSGPEPDPNLGPGSGSLFRLDRTSRSGPGSGLRLPNPNRTGPRPVYSCGFEAGSECELKTVQEFVKRKSQEKRLKGRLHAIWFVLLCIYSSIFTWSRLLFRYCIPMDNDRPSLDLKYFGAICPDKNGMPMLKYDYG